MYICIYIYVYIYPNDPSLNQAGYGDPIRSNPTVDSWLMANFIPVGLM